MNVSQNFCEKNILDSVHVEAVYPKLLANIKKWKDKEVRYKIGPESYREIPRNSESLFLSRRKSS